MAEVETGRYTVGVFKDVASAERGIDALKRQGFPAEALTMMAKDGPEVSGLLQKVFGRVPAKVEVHGRRDGGGRWRSRRPRSTRRGRNWRNTDWRRA